MEGRPGPKTPIPQANLNNAETLTEQDIRDWKEKRIQESKSTVQVSTSLHGGPWGGCDDCHELSQEQRLLLRDPKTQWLEIQEKWLRHRAVD